MEKSFRKYQTLVQTLGLLGLLTACGAFMLSILPLAGMFAVFPGLLSLVISIIGLGVATKHQLPKAALIAALLFALVAICFSLLQFNALG